VVRGETPSVYAAALGSYASALNCAEALDYNYGQVLPHVRAVLADNDFWPAPTPEMKVRAAPVRVTVIRPRERETGEK
jgi:hypothetical protein